MCKCKHMLTVLMFAAGSRKCLMWSWRRSTWTCQPSWGQSSVMQPTQASSYQLYCSWCECREETVDNMHTHFEPKWSIWSNLNKYFLDFLTPYLILNIELNLIFEFLVSFVMLNLSWFHLKDAHCTCTHLWTADTHTNVFTQIIICCYRVCLKRLQNSPCCLCIH